jgi:hypothetical protein
MATPALYDLRQTWKPFLLEIAGHAIRKTVLYVLAFVAVFTAAAYDYQWLAEIEGWIASRVGGSLFPAGLALVYVLGGIAPAIYLGITKGITDQAERIGELIRQAGRPLLEQVSNDTRSKQSVSLDALRRFLRTSDSSAVPGSLAPPKHMPAIAAALKSRAFRPVRTFLEQIVNELDSRGMRDVTLLQFAEAALPVLPEFVTREILSRWRISSYVAWALAVVWFILPIVLTYLLRSQ